MESLFRYAPPPSPCGYLPDQRYANLPTVYTIHNLMHQGTAPWDVFAYLGLLSHSLREERFGEVNFMARGIYHATMVSTVSPKASDTPTKPMPRPCTGPAKFAARTALPQPPSTSQNVPNNSAARRFDNCMFGYPKIIDAREARSVNARPARARAVNVQF